MDHNDQKLHRRFILSELFLVLAAACVFIGMMLFATTLIPGIKTSELVVTRLLDSGLFVLYCSVILSIAAVLTKPPSR